MKMKFLLKFMLIFVLNLAFLKAEFALVKFDEKLLENGSLQGYLVSEKLDGVRAIWDGKVLKSRSNKAFAVPLCWVQNLPPFALDGELFIARDKFEALLSVVNSSIVSCEAWESVKYYIFDAPNASGTLLERLKMVQDFINLKQSKTLVLIEQKSVKSISELNEMLKSVESSGGEGLVVRKNATPYENFRTKNAMKLKSFEDSECVVIAHNEGKGKFKGKMGSLSCEEVISLNSENLSESQNFANLNDKNASSKNSAKQSKKIVFKIGSGFSDAQRENPPKIGTKINYKFKGRTKNDLPRFPVFLRVREIE